MKAGKITEVQCKRSVLRQLPKTGSSVIQGAGIGNDYGAFRLTDGCQVVTAMAAMTLTNHEPEKYAFWKALNKLETSGAIPMAIMVNALLPARGNESRIKEMTQNLTRLCMDFEVEYLGGHTELKEELRVPAITIIAYGTRICEETGYSVHKVKPGEWILMLGHAALETTSILLADRWEALNSRYAAGYLQTAVTQAKDLSLHRAFSVLREEPVTYIHDISTGGVFAALWELGEGAGCGIEVSLKSIPIRQETIEVCEFFNINPYMALSGGSALLVTPEGEALAEHLRKHGIAAIMIGQTTEQNDRIVTNGDDVRYLELPNGDEIYKIYRN